MEEKQFRQRNFEKKIKFVRFSKQNALRKIDIEDRGGNPAHYYKDELTQDYLDANDKIMQLEEEDRAQLRKDKIYPFYQEVMKQYTRHIFHFKNKGPTYRYFTSWDLKDMKQQKDQMKKIVYNIIIQKKNNK